MKLKALILAVVLGIGSSAPAAKVLITYTGTVSDAFDTSGEFGVPNSDLSGLPYKVVFKLSPKPGTFIYNDGVFGITSGSGATNPLTATLYINGLSHFFTQEGVASLTNGSGLGSEDRVLHLVRLGIDPFNGFIFQTIFSSDHDFVSSSDYAHSLNYSVQPGDTVDGMFGIRGKDGPTGGFLSPETITITSFVPEPAAWAMMIAGFGLVGGMLRYKKNAVKARV